MASFLTLALLASTSIAAPATGNIFASTNWPQPHVVTGEDDSAHPNDATQGWGGIHVHDPSIVLGPDGHYFSFSTHGLTAISRASKAGSLDGDWKILGSVLKGKSVISNSGNADPWAPDVHKVGSTYYNFYSVSQFGSQVSSIGLATSTTLLPGSWTDHGAILSSSPTAAYPLNTSNAIDAALFVDPKTDIPYLNYGSFWSDIFQVQLSSNLMKANLKTAVGLSFDPVGTQAEEGSYMSYSGGYYYLWYSHGICCGYDPSALPAKGTEYSIRVGRSKAATGPFVDSNGVDLRKGGGNIVYGSHGNIYGPGGQGILSGYNGRDVLYFHYVNTTSDPKYADNLKLLGWDYINYSSGWPVLSYD
ncbi:hypothetical protein LTR78_001546 [Recurvomyces mirabilis]|uniref:Arabinan endo-1,5-alpha-L-arabinosidase n=1 Tax=Recurvomyces mirabilis TaxID=574656 RepID=A0AAE0WU61_9PEZI|nr:hypothetical protein LTR78_001546 [Recurvomyces mirabilis]KAK5151882.1 hypothetical protein LTS14_009016 [Recurvomyces mirabilis]